VVWCGVFLLLLVWHAQYEDSVILTVKYQDTVLVPVSCVWRGSVWCGVFLLLLVRIQNEDSVNLTVEYQDTVLVPVSRGLVVLWWR
jgi:hypothetical protein